MASSGSKEVVLIALGTNLGIVLAKFTAATWTRSSAMLSEAIHSLVDTSNQALLLYGLARSQRQADARHPFGYSKELYFWSFVVAVLLFSMGAGVSIYEGLEKLHNPHPISDFWINYLVLGVALALESVSAYKALSEFQTRRGARGWFAAQRASKDAALFTVVVEDVAAVTSLLIALVALLCVQHLGWDRADAIASIAIGLLLATVGAFMSIEIKSLLVGEAANPKVMAGIEAILAGEVKPGSPLIAINEIRSMHLGPEDVLVAASVDAIDGLPAEKVEALTTKLERAIRARFPEVRRLFIETQSAAGHLGESSGEAAPAHAAEPATETPEGASPPSRKAKKRAKRRSTKAAADRE
jgi:cation diffusion facilitator family transporter